MSSLFPKALALLLLMGGSAAADDLRVCADPDNLPFSNARQQGFENHILGLVARDLGLHLVYVWGNERRATAIEVMTRGRCDLVPGSLAGAPGVLTTRPYMRSSYALVMTGRETVTGLDDPRLRALRIGVQSVGDDALTPPAEALLQRGLGGNLRPFTLHGNAAEPNSAGAMVQAVARHRIDAAVLWGPFAGYFAAAAGGQLSIVPVTARADDPPMSFAVAMATRRDSPALRQAVDGALARHREEIAGILARYHVPLLPLTQEASP